MSDLSRWLERTLPSSDAEPPVDPPASAADAPALDPTSLEADLAQRTAERQLEGTLVDLVQAQGLAPSAVSAAVIELARRQGGEGGF